MASIKPEPTASFRELSLDVLEGIVGGAKGGQSQQSYSQQEEATFEASWLLHVDALSQAQVSAIPLAEFGKRERRFGMTREQAAMISRLICFV